MTKKETFQAENLPTALEMRDSAKKYGLKHLNVLYKYPDDVLTREFNGVGPDRWPEEVRNLFSWLLRDVLEAVCVHDLDYFQGGDETAFHEANRVLKENVKLLARKKYGWWRPRRWFLTNLAYDLESWTDKYGWEGWNKTGLTPRKQ